MKAIFLILTFIFLFEDSDTNRLQDFFYYSLDEIIKYEEKNSDRAHVYNIYFFKTDTTNKILEYAVGSSSILNELEEDIGSLYFIYQNRMFIFSGSESAYYTFIKQNISQLTSVQDCPYSDTLIKLKYSSHSKDYLSIHINYENGKVSSYIGNYNPFPLFFEQKHFNQQSKIDDYRH